MAQVRDYIDIVGKPVMDELFTIGDRARSLTVQHVNSTAVGGGVAEILTRLVPMMNELGVQARWDVIKGGERFFTITKKMHNALHGVSESFTDDEWNHFLEVDRNNGRSMNFDSSVVFIHDPQPIGLVEQRSHLDNKWVWRCHIDFSEPEENVWLFLKDFIERFDGAIFSAPAFSRPLKTRQFLISPSIDPLSDKNRDLEESYVSDIFDRFSIDRTRPVVTQISRFDYLKDPVGVIKAYKLVKQYVDCQLVLAGGGATDDPEGDRVLNEVRNAAEGDKDIFVLLLPPSSDLEINALQRGSTVILQKSLKEGFGLTVAEGLWKSKPVIASAVGGIPLQIKHKYNGILTHSIEGTAYWIKQLINDSAFAGELGRNGREHIRQNFLITRHLRDYLLLSLSLFYDKDLVYL
ncbi:MAG TPA: glycosyltransferase [Candidatus Acidoferrales bacterium]|nr:glycosyltransferase [Candidatus Acidoferrales bacterium]